MNDRFESTYALLVRSEDKERNALEFVVYLLVVLSAIFSIGQFAHQTLAFPIDKIVKNADRVMHAQRS